MRRVITNNELDSICRETLELSSIIDPNLTILYDIMYRTGCRINDVLEFNRWTVLMNGNIQLEPQKNNNLRVFQESELPSIFYDNLVNNYNFLNGYFYGKCEYHLKSIINKYDIRRYDKKITTHIFRHNYAKKMSDTGMTNEQVRVKLGEKQLSSATGYISSVLTGYL